MLYVAVIDANCAPRQAVGTYSAAWMTEETKKDSTIRRPQDTRKSSSLCPTKEEFQACTPCVEHTRTASKPTGACLRRWAQSATGTSGDLLRQTEAFSLGRRNKKKEAHTQKKVLNCHRGALPCPEHAQ